MAMIAIQFCPHSTAGLNEPFITNFLSFGCSWFYLLCNFLIFFFLVLLILHCNYLHNYTCSDLHYSVPRCIIKTSDPTQLHFNIDVNFSSSSSITKRIFIKIFPIEELFFFCSSCSMHRMLISCIAFTKWGCPSLQVNLFFFHFTSSHTETKQNKNKNTRW